ncbi:MAG: rhodanese-like domain-containing protein [Chloroflexi bacterium]|nr:rhodanese-like domain-containing protein [Chloroflexota bacterium]
MPRDIDRHGVQLLQASGAAVVEVLPTEEFENEHLPGAISLPLGDLSARSAEARIGPDKGRPVVVYCQSVD